MNMRMRTALLLSALALLSLTSLTPTAARAQAADSADGNAGAEYIPLYMDFSEGSSYLRAGAAQSWSEFSAPDVASRVGFDLAAGIRFHRNFAAELEFESIPYWKINGVETSTYAATLNGRAYFPYRRFHPFVQAGLGTLISEQGKDSTARFAYRFGFGLDVYVTERLFLSATYTRYVGNLDDFGYSNIVYGIGYQIY